VEQVMSESTMWMMRLFGRIASDLVAGDEVERELTTTE
jgi:hypothetical protein